MSRTTVLSVVGALVAFILLWQAVVVVSGFPPFILPAPGPAVPRLAPARAGGRTAPRVAAPPPCSLPAPGRVFARLASAWADGTIEPHFAATLVEVALGFVVGAALG